MARRHGLVLSGFLMLSVLSFPATALSVLALPAAAGAVAADPTATTPVPTTEAPTAPPTTEAPTVIPTEPVPTTPAEPTEPTGPVEPTTPATTDLPTIVITPDNAGDSTPVWPWVLAGLGALVVIGGIILIARSASRRTDTETAWRTRRLNAYAQGAALHDAILSASSGPPADGTSSDIQLGEIQRRANDFTQRLYQLREAAPDQDGQLRVERVLASLQALRSAMDTERASGPVNGMTADITRERLNDFRVSLYDLRDPE
jgi:hypothetical protein